LQPTRSYWICRMTADCRLRFHHRQRASLALSTVFIFHFLRTLLDFDYNRLLHENVLEQIHKYCSLRNYYFLNSCHSLISSNTMDDEQETYKMWRVRKTIMQVR